MGAEFHCLGVSLLIGLWRLRSRGWFLCCCWLAGWQAVKRQVFVVVVVVVGGKHMMLPITREKWSMLRNRNGTAATNTRKSARVHATVVVTTTYRCRTWCCCCDMFFCFCYYSGSVALISVGRLVCLFVCLALRLLWLCSVLFVVYITIFSFLVICICIMSFMAMFVPLSIRVSVCPSVRFSFRMPVCLTAYCLPNAFTSQPPTFPCWMQAKSPKIFHSVKFCCKF